MSFYFPRVINLRKMNITNVNIETTWNYIYGMGDIYIYYTYIGLDVKFCARIFYKKDMGRRKRYEECKLFTKLHGFNNYIETSMDTYFNENIPSFNVIKEIFEKYKLKDVIRMVDLKKISIC
tara:strand:+ start:848 stop:1213 length:366 start_codon:yes stop_codon:yes gene_type:complete